MKHHPIYLTSSLFVALLCAACATEPDGPLTGQWGGRLVSLSARQSGVELRFACMGAALPTLVADSTGHFEGTATITWVSFAGLDPRTTLHVSGLITGSEMTLAGCGRTGDL